MTLNLNLICLSKSTSPLSTMRDNRRRNSNPSTKINFQKLTRFDKGHSNHNLMTTSQKYPKLTQSKFKNKSMFIQSQAKSRLNNPNKSKPATKLERGNRSRRGTGKSRRSPDVPTRLKSTTQKGCAIIATTCTGVRAWQRHAHMQTVCVTRKACVKTATSTRTT